MAASSQFEADPLTGKTIAAALEVNKTICPGLIVSIYEKALSHELGLRGIHSRQQIYIDVVYKGVVIKGQRIDLIVENEVIIEVKSLSKVHEVVFAQILS